MSWLKTSKTLTDTGFLVAEPSYTYAIELEYYKEMCAGCGMCVVACPEDAIKIKDQEKLIHKSAGINLIDVDEEKCVKCGVCAATCIFNALKLRHRDNLAEEEDYRILAVERGVYPSFQVTAKIDLEKCTFCKLCEKMCPRKAITVVRKKQVDINPVLCIGCGWCEWICPTSAITTKKPLKGSIKVNSEACKTDCDVCVSVCPADALYSKSIAESKFGKVKTNIIEKRILKHETERTTPLNEFCILCGACKQVCPVEECIEIEREKVSIPKLRSAKLWSRVQEKLHKATREAGRAE